MSAEATTPNVAITYCRLCGWLLSASWKAQEL
jgi:predicted Rdx family selenoprotein